MPTLREQFEPRIRAAGIRATARAASVAPSTLSDWLAGRKDLTLGTLERLAGALDVELAVRSARRGARARR